MKLSDTEKKTLVDESVKYWQSTLEIHPYDLMNIANYWLSKFDSILEKKEKDIVEKERKKQERNIINFLNGRGYKVINKLNNK